MAQPFHGLLSQLREEHDREVALLNAQLAELRAILKTASLPDPTWEEHAGEVQAVRINHQKDDSEFRPRSELKRITPSSPSDPPAPMRGLSPRPGRLDKPTLSDDVARSTSTADLALAAAAGLEQLRQLTINNTDKVAESQVSEEDFAVSRFDLKMCWTKCPVASEAIVSDLDQKLVSSHAKNMMETVHRHDVPDIKKRDNMHFIYHMQSRCLINPGQPSRVMWDLTGMILISYDMMIIPMHMSFQPEPHWITTAMGWATLLFWSADMFASVCTGYFKNGKLVMDQQSIILNYLKGWFWLDCIVVLPDWVMKAMGSVTNVAGLGRILRIARVMRVLRLLRLLKLKKLFALVYDLIDSEVMFIVVNLIQLLTVILVMNHIVACAWYMVGRVSKENGAPKNWLQDIGLTPVWESSLEWKYLTSLHWSITQFTPASMDVSATNAAERFFSIVILFWALVALSSIIGSVSASMTALRNMSSDENKQFWILRRYLRQRHISRDLIQRIIKYLEFQSIQKHNTVLTGSVKLLANLSDQFSIELAHQLNAPTMLDHPFFKFLAEEGSMPLTMYRLCSVGLQNHAFAFDEVVFNPGDEGMRMYVVKTGSFEYKLVDNYAVETTLTPRLWAAEASLWTNWRHRGWLSAQRPAEAMGIVPSKLYEVFHLHPRPWYYARNYAVEFVNYLNNIGTSAQTDVLFDSAAWDRFVQVSDTYQLTRSLLTEDSPAAEAVYPQSVDTTITVTDDGFTDITSANRTGPTSPSPPPSILKSI
jgi:hypothetical protein